MAIEIAATLCQFIQRTDPRFPLVYFTVCSGLLAGFGAALEVLGQTHRSSGAYRVAAAVGVVLSAAIFALVIAPATPTGTWFQPWDDPWVRVATVLFHGVAPVLVLARLLLDPPKLSFRGWMADAFAWPLMYLAAIGTAAAGWHLMIPYPFLSPAEMGCRSVAVAVLSMAALIGVTTAVLFGAAHAVGRRIL